MKIKIYVLIVSLVYMVNSHAVIFVDLNANGNNDGSSWTDAFISLQDAIDVAVAGDEIHIAQGVYQQGAEISVAVSLTLKGGFPTGGGQQDIDSNPTVLDGNNAHRVILASHNSGQLILEGLEITNGFLGDSTECIGAGINTSGELVLNQSKVINNILRCNRSAGAGIYSLNGTMTLNNSQVNNNIADVSYLSTTSPINGAFGGGICIAAGTLNIINSTVSNNRIFGELIDAESDVFGGGIYASGDINLINSWVSDNSGYTDVYFFGMASGGGVYSNGGTFMVINSAIIKNGVLARGDSNDAVIESKGGGIFNNGGTLILKNSLVADNGVGAEFNANATATGGGIYGSVTLDNSLLWNNSSTLQGFKITASEHEVGVLTASYSLIKDQNPSGMGNIDATVPGFDPLFIDAANNNYRLSFGSPLIDAGNLDLLPLDDFDLDNDNDLTESHPFDLDETPRLLGFNVDIGPFETDVIFKDGFEN